MTKHSNELKAQVIKEIAEVGSIKIVADKHGVNPKTAYAWVRDSKAVDNVHHVKSVKALNQQLKDKDLEIRVLKDLLKKTVQVLSSEDKPLS